MDEGALDEDALSRRVSNVRLESSASVGALSQHTFCADSNAEEDDEENQLSVLLGFVEKPQHAWSLSRQLFPSKAGGTPAWLDPVNLPTGNEKFCGICGKPMQFLLQVYAAIEGKEDAFHRTLFVFMCPEMNCLRKDKQNQCKMLEQKPDRSVKVFRCQLRQRNEFYSKNPPLNNGLDRPITKGASLCIWCGTWKGEKKCGSCKRASYCSRHHQLEHWKSGHASVCKAQHGKSTEESEVEMLNGEVKALLHQVDANFPACNKLWPEFEIVDEEEGSDEETSNENMALMSTGRDDDISRQFQEVEPTLEQQHWASFQARISRAPGQVLRYCRSNEAKPLWPRLDERLAATSIPPCPNCNRPRIFEFQVLPQLLYYFKVSNDADAFDWGTIAIYTCEASCVSPKPYSEEFVWVQSA